MDIGLHTTLLDTNSIADPEVIAFTEQINPLMGKEFGKVWDLFTTRPAPLETDTFEILSRNYTAPEVVLGTVGSSNDWDSVSDATALPITSGTIDRITVGDILLVDSEIVVVKSVDRNANTIDVYERGAGDTSGATHTTSTVAQIIGSAHIEGTVNLDALAEQTATLTNYAQIVLESIDLSKEDTDQARKIGQTAEVLKREAMERVMRKLARTAIHGTARVGTASIPATTRGLISHLNDVNGAIKTTVSGAFTETVLQDALDDVREAGGTVNAIVLSVAQKRVANGFTGVDQIQTNRDDKTGGHVLDAYMADGMGTIPFVVDVDWPSARVAGVNSRFMGKAWKKNDELRFVPETNVSSRERKETLQGKFGLWVEGVGKTHFLLNSLT